MAQQKLREKWHNLSNSLRLAPQGSELLLQELLTLYAQPHRAYHNLTHIQKMLDLIEQMKFLAINEQNIQLATWFHDCIYEPRTHNNEEKSAEFAVNKLRDLSVDYSIINTVKNLILKTKYHDNLPQDIDTQILLDADLSILGAEPDEYEHYAQAIRQEYSWVEPQEYAQKRRQVLEKFLAQKRIFQTDFCWQKLEDQARINLQQEIQILTRNDDAIFFSIC